jgi:hypothetical protein
MKFRVWAGRPTLATEQGKSIESPQALEVWLEKQPDGNLEVWAGRWWALSVEAVPFTVKAGECHCAHPKYRSKKGADTKDFPGFFAHEAYIRAAKVSDFYGAIPDMVGDMIDAAKTDDE